MRSNTMRATADAAAAKICAKLRREACDAMLTAIPVGKRLALGQVWNGLQKISDFVSTVANEYSTPFTPPNILTAEPTPPELDLDLAANGLISIVEAARDVGDQLRKTGHAAAADQLARDVDQAAKAIADATELLANGQPHDPNEPGPNEDVDETSRVRAVVGNPGGGQVMGNTKTGDTRHPMLGRSTRVGDFSKPVSNSDANVANAKFWAERNSPTFNSGDATRAANGRKLLEQSRRR